MIALLLACAEATDSGEPYTFEETLSADDVHLLISSDVFTEGHALTELSPDLETELWTGDVEPGTGALGSLRLAGGDTVFAHIQAPPVYFSSFDRMAPDGSIVWSYDELTAIGFSHGVVVTNDGTYIGLDTVAGRVLAFDEAGTLVWEVSTSEEGESYRPNGISLREEDDGTILIATTLLERSEDAGPDVLAMWSTTDSAAAPTQLWRAPVQDNKGEEAWAHGPRFQSDGSLTLCQSANGQVVGYDVGTGLELWRFPETGQPAQLMFPRDALLLPDGSYVIADGAAEVLRVADPFESFTVVAARTMPGIFAVTDVVCGDGGGLPCLGG